MLSPVSCCVEGVSYEVDPQLGGERVTLLWGLFDQELYIEHGGAGSAHIGRHGALSPLPLPHLRRGRGERA